MTMHQQRNDIGGPAINSASTQSSIWGSQYTNVALSAGGGALNLNHDTQRALLEQNIRQIETQLMKLNAQ